MIFTSKIEIQVSTIGLVLTINQTISQTTSSSLNLANYMPDIKVEDFFSGVLKMFNLTCLSYEENVYDIEQIEDWYASSSIIDITEYTLSDDVEINRLETFKKINFNYTKSESFMNVNYLGNNGFEYGNLKADLNSEGSEYTVQLPFENLLFQKFTGQNLQVGYSLKTDFKPYIPKPIILYDYATLQSCNFYLKGTGSAINITTYNSFGQDSLISGVNQSLNFGIETSSLLLVPITNTLYSNYYQSYLENIYNLKARKYNIKAVLPISLLTSIKLNNRLVIRDKRYIINNMKIDLTSGEVDFELINDFRVFEEQGVQTLLAVNDSYNVSRINTSVLNVRDNDILTEPEDIIESINSSGFILGSLAIVGDAENIIFTPNGGTGTGTFQYTIKDSLENRSTATVTITTS
jgi:hypothetical protein